MRPLKFAVGNGESFALQFRNQMPATTIDREDIVIRSV